MTTISITRALIELKTLEKRIQKKLNDLQPVTVLIGNKVDSSTTSKEEFEKEAKASYQSLMALVEHKRKIKAAIVKSNATTVIEVAGEKMTVAEAIERKNSIETEKEIRKNLSGKYAEKLKLAEQHNSSVQNQLYKLLQATYSKPETEISKDDYDKIATPFKENNDAKLVDPLQIKETMKLLDERIQLFEAEVDIALTESNARTEIEV